MMRLFDLSEREMEELENEVHNALAQYEKSDNLDLSANEIHRFTTGYAMAYAKYKLNNGRVE